MLLTGPRNPLLNKHKQIGKLYFFFFTGIFLYELGNLLHTVINNNFLRVFQLTGIIFLMFSSLKIPKLKLYNTYFRKVYKLFLCWSFFIILRAKALDANEVRLVLYQPIHIFAYLVPLIAVFPVNVLFFKKLFNFSIVFTLFFIIIIGLVVFAQNNLVDIIFSGFFFGTPLLLLSFRYQKVWVRMLAIVSTLLGEISGAIQGRRNVIITTSLFLVISILIYIFYYHKRNLTKMFVVIFTILLCSLFAIGSIEIDNVKAFSALTDRIDTDSRSEVIDAFNKDFNGSDWIWGRGIDGAYYNPLTYWNFTNQDSHEVIYRDTIENGFLYFILKGGIINLILFLLIILPAIFNGLIKSKNAISITCASILLVYLVDMISFGQPALSFKYIVVWFSISICYSKNITIIPEIELNKLFRRS